MSVKKAVATGKVNSEIENLLAEKDKAKKAGDTWKCRAIRRQLRKLGYKRAIAKGEVEAPKKDKEKPTKKVAPKKIEPKKKVSKAKEVAEDDDEVI